MNEQKQKENKLEEEARSVFELIGEGINKKEETDCCICCEILEQEHDLVLEFDKETLKKSKSKNIAPIPSAIVHAACFETFNTHEPHKRLVGNLNKVDYLLYKPKEKKVEFLELKEALYEQDDVDMSLYLSNTLPSSGNEDLPQGMTDRIIDFGLLGSPFSARDEAKVDEDAALREFYLAQSDNGMG